MVRDLDVALELVAIADSITMGRFRRPSLAMEFKADLSIVTEVDRAVETAIRRHVRYHRPSGSTIGEKYGGAGVGGRRWIIDPIDGTANFARGHPGWATFITLEIDGELEIGVGSFPTAAKRIWAMRGRGAFDGAVPVHVSQTLRIEDARVLTCDTELAGRRDLAEGIRRLGDHSRRVQRYDGALATLDVARGTAEALIDIGGVWDYAPLKLIVEEAGGYFTDLQGDPHADCGSALASNGLLHPRILEALAAARGP